MLKFLLITLIIFYSILGYSQDSVFNYRGKVVDLLTKKPLPNVNIQIEGSLRGTITDNKGNFEILIKAPYELLKFSCIGYETIYLNPDTQNNKEHLVGLKQKAVDIKEIIINAKTIEIIAKTNRSYVLDYDFYDENILLISYSLGKMGYKALLVNEHADTLSSITIPEEPIMLFKDCIGNHYVVCKTSIYQIYYDFKTLHFLPPKSINDFESVLLPCVTSDSTNFYTVTKSGSYVVSGIFHDFNSNHTALLYSFINKRDKTKTQLINITDEEAIRLKADERSSFAHKSKSFKKDFDIVFTETIVFKEIFAPLYVIKDKIYVFDFINSKLLNFSVTGKFINEVKLELHKDLKWKRYMCVDEKTQKVYTLFENNGISELKEIDLVTGKECNSKKIPLVFVDNIKVRDHYIYFLYKENSYDDTKYLSRMRLD